MCNFFSYIITEHEVLYSLNTDSHEEIIEEFNLDDTTLTPDFVRGEILPIDGNIFNHNIDNWKIKIDQDLMPNWFNIDNYKTELHNILQNIVFKKLFLTGYKENFFKIRTGRLFANNSNIKCYNSCIIECHNSCTIKGYDHCIIRGYDSCIIEGHNFCTIEGNDSCTIKGYNSCTIKGYFSSNIECHDSCTIEGYDSCIIKGYDSCIIKKISDKVNINKLDFKSIIIDYTNNTITTKNDFKLIKF